MYGLLLALVAVSAAAQYNPSAALDSEVIRLARIRVVAAENLRSMPNYTCVQTIERSRRTGPKRRFELLDTIRLEVALVDGKELFSWPGAGKFEDRRIGDLVGGGTIGNGNFALHARSVFLSNAARFEFDAEVEQNGRRVIRYRYVVPRMSSGYQVRIGELEEVVGYRGSFDVDASTLDLLRLEVIADEIPPRLPIQSASDVMLYARQRIGGNDFLLPQSSELTMVAINGMESRNRVHFASCRQYSGESVLSFADAPVEESPAPPVAPVVIDLDEDLYLDLRIDTPVRFGLTSVGDQIFATLAGDVKRKGRVILPKGAGVKGRLLRIEKRRLRQREGLALELDFTEIEFPGHRAELHAWLADIGPVVFPGMQAGFERGRQSSDNMFYVNRLELPKGFRMLWRTKSIAR